MKIINPSMWDRSAKLMPISTPKNRLCISTAEGQVIISKNDISHLAAEGNYCHIFYNGTDLCCSRTLKDISSRLLLPRFIKVHKSFVVNFDKIVFIDSSFSTISMEDGTRIPIARAKKQMIKDMIALQFD